MLISHSRDHTVTATQVLWWAGARSIPSPGEGGGGGGVTGLCQEQLPDPAPAAQPPLQGPPRAAVQSAP